MSARPTRDRSVPAQVLDAGDDDDDDFGWVPPSATTKTTAWNVVGDRGASEGGRAKSDKAEVRRLERLLSEEQAAHRSSVRSLETQVSRLHSQLSKMQTWADDKVEHLRASTPSSPPPGRRRSQSDVSEVVIDADDGDLAPPYPGAF